MAAAAAKKARLDLNGHKSMTEYDDDEQVRIFSCPVTKISKLLIFLGQIDSLYLVCSYVRLCDVIWLELLVKHYSNHPLLKKLHSLDVS